MLIVCRTGWKKKKHTPWKPCQRSEAGRCIIGAGSEDQSLQSGEETGRISLYAALPRMDRLKTLYLHTDPLSASSVGRPAARWQMPSRAIFSTGERDHWHPFLPYPGRALVPVSFLINGQIRMNTNLKRKYDFSQGSPQLGGAGQGPERGAPAYVVVLNEEWAHETG